MNIDERIPLTTGQLQAFCQRHQISKLSAFGSVLRNDFGPDSDIDVLVEFLPTARIGLFALVRAQKELEELLHRKVDLRTPKDLSHYFRQEVSNTARRLHG